MVYQLSFSSIVGSGSRYVRSVNIWIDVKCLVSTKSCLSSTKDMSDLLIFGLMLNV